MQFSKAQFPLFAASALFCVCAGGTVRGQAPVPTPSTGPQEIEFKNGKKFVGEVVAIEGRRVRLVPYDGSAFGMDWSTVKSARALTAVEQLRARAVVLEAKGNAPAAVKLIEPAVKEHPELQADVDRLMGRVHTEGSALRAERMKAYREKFDAAFDRRQLDEARDLVKTELERTPADSELLEDMLTVEFIMNRAAGGKAADFKSETIAKLEAVDPESAILAGIKAEIGRGETLQANFESARRNKISSAVKRAEDLYKREQLGEAKGVLEEALALNPDPTEARPMRDLLGKINGELAAERADKREEQMKRLADYKAKNPIPQMGQQSVSDKDLARMKDKRVQRALQSARRGKGRDINPH